MCYATLLFRAPDVNATARRDATLEQRMVRLWARAMLRTTSLPVYAMVGPGAEPIARALSATHSGGRRVEPYPVPILEVSPRGTLPWYRQQYSKLHAWSLPCSTVTYTDYDGWPLRSMDGAFDACPAQHELCAAVDTVTPIAPHRRGNYLNGGVLVLRPNRSFYLELLRWAARDARAKSARYYAEQGLLNALFPHFGRLPARFNMQGAALSSRAMPNPATDVFVHEKFYKLRRAARHQLGLRAAELDCERPEAWMSEARLWPRLCGRRTSA